MIIAAMFLLPMLLVGQSETTSIKLNSITGSVFLSGDSGFAVDYRRTVKKNQQLVLGIQDDGFASPEFVFGYRANLKSEKKLSYAVGFDLLLRKRNVIGDNILSRTIEILPKPVYSSVRAVGGLYYQINDRLDFMTELHVKTLLAVFTPRATNALHIGLKYDF